MIHGCWFTRPIDFVFKLHVLSYNKHVCVCACVCVTRGHWKCINLQPNATASLVDGDCGPQKGRPVR